MHQDVTLTNSADKRNAFEFWYAGWRDFLEGRPMSTGPFSRLSEKQAYQDGYKAAERALEEMLK